MLVFTSFGLEMEYRDNAGTDSLELLYLRLFGDWPKSSCRDAKQMMAILKQIEGSELIYEFFCLPGYPFNSKRQWGEDEYRQIGLTLRQIRNSCGAQIQALF